MKKALKIIGGIFGILIVIGLIAGGGDETPKNEAKVVSEVKSETKKENTKEEVKKEEPEKAPYEITLKEGSYDEYGVTYTLEGVLVNNKKDVSYIQIEIPAYDSEGNKVDTLLANCSGLKKGESWKFEAFGLKEGITKVGEPEVTGF